MIRSSVTISLVPEARGGPFVFWDDHAAACREAKRLGFDAVEVFAPPDVDAAALRRSLDDNGLKLAAMGTGVGWVLHRLTLTSPNAAKREQAIRFIRSVIDVAGSFGAPAIIGSMQGRHGDGVEKTQAIAYLVEGLNALGEHARQYGVPLLFEPLNRYETNLVSTVEDGVRLVRSVARDNRETARRSVSYEHRRGGRSRRDPGGGRRHRPRPFRGLQPPAGRLRPHRLRPHRGSACGESASTATFPPRRCRIRIRRKRRR